VEALLDAIRIMVDVLTVKAGSMSPLTNSETSRVEVRQGRKAARRLARSQDKRPSG
jgi:hypothetical protein